MSKRRPRLPETEIIQVPIGAHVVELEQVKGVEAMVHRAILEDGVDAPYWAVLWPSAKALATYVAQAPDLTNRRVLELGCGIGAASVVAAARGATVVASDIEPRAIMLAERNAKRNGLEVEGMIVDWDDPPTDLGSFDGILAADVMYGDGMVAGVLRFIRRHLTRDGLAVIADPNRVMTGGISGAARIHGLSVETVASRPGMAAVGGVSIYHLTRRR